MAIVVACAALPACMEVDPPEPVGSDISVSGRVCTTNSVSKTTCKNITSDRANPSVDAESK